MFWSCPFADVIVVLLYLGALGIPPWLSLGLTEHQALNVSALLSSCFLISLLLLSKVFKLLILFATIQFYLSRESMSEPNSSICWPHKWRFASVMLGKKRLGYDRLASLTGYNLLIITCSTLKKKLNSYNCIRQENRKSAFGDIQRLFKMLKSCTEASGIFFTSTFWVFLIHYIVSK